MMSMVLVLQNHKIESLNYAINDTLLNLEECPSNTDVALNDYLQTQKDNYFRNTLLIDIKSNYNNPPI